MGQKITDAKKGFIHVYIPKLWPMKKTPQIYGIYKNVFIKPLPLSFAAPAAPRKVSILSNKDGLVINWIPPTCDEMSSKPVKYQLSWCRTDGKSNHCQGIEWGRKSVTGHMYFNLKYLLKA